MDRLACCVFSLLQSAADISFDPSRILGLQEMTMRFSECPGVEIGYASTALMAPFGF